MWIEAAIAAGIAILIILFFADKPPTPPSVSKQMNTVTENFTMVQFLKDTWKVLSSMFCEIEINMI